MSEREINSKSLGYALAQKKAQLITIHTVRQR